MSITPETSPAGVCAGVDWAKDDHAVGVGGAGEQALARFSVAHDTAGLTDMTRRLLKLGMVKVGTERPDGPVVDALLGAGLTVLVIPPAQVKNPRGRYGSAGNKDDRIDAYVLSDVVPTDQRRLRRDTAQTTALRTTVQARRDLVAHRAAVANHPPEPPQAPPLAPSLDAARRRARLDPLGTERTPAHLRRLLVRRGHLGRVAPHLFTLSHPPSRATTWTGLIRSGEVEDVLVNTAVTIRGAASRSPGSVRSSV